MSEIKAYTGHVLKKIENSGDEKRFTARVDNLCGRPDTTLE